MKNKTQRYTRREFLRAGLGVVAGAPLVLAGACGGGGHAANEAPPPSGPPRADAKVAIVSCRTYGAEVRSALEQAFTLLGGIGSLVGGKTVTVKVNLTCGGSFADVFGRPPGESYITDGRTAIALASVLLDQGAQKVRFVDAVGFLQPMEQILVAAGWDAASLLALGNVELENTRNLGSGAEYVRMNVPGGGYLFNYFEVNHSYRDADVFISMAKLKQHNTGGVTLSMKNVFGSTPLTLYGNDAGNEDAVGSRLRLMHGQGISGWGPAPPPGARTDRDPGVATYRIPRIVADICAARPVHLAILDGITCMSGGEGPWSPSTGFIEPGILIAGLNPVSTDAVGMAVMGFPNPRATRGTRPFQSCDNHLLLGEQAGIGSADLARIEVRGMTVQQALCPYPG